MFGVGFSELLVVAVIALLVLGPERLPKAARFAGLWVRRARAQWYSVKSELERELATDELRRTLAEPTQELEAVSRETYLSMNEATRAARDAAALPPEMPPTSGASPLAPPAAHSAADQQTTPPA
ncbi:MAG: Sec-independent protein translocase protein TatB [Xanthomonadaceae bacterium]|nr:Sec-independent protein translocase protein TatB [Xanthomonadaceae bacterium]